MGIRYSNFKSFCNKSAMIFFQKNFYLINLISHSQPLTLRLRSYEKSRGALNYWGQNLLISSVQKKSFLIRPVLGINRISSMCLSIFLNFFCTYHPRTPPKGTCSLLKMVPPKIEPKHGLLDINRIDSMHLSNFF